MDLSLKMSKLFSNVSLFHYLGFLRSFLPLNGMPQIVFLLIMKEIITLVTIELKENNSRIHYYLQYPSAVIRLVTSNLIPKKSRVFENCPGLYYKGKKESWTGVESWTCIIFVGLFL